MADYKQAFDFVMSHEDSTLSGVVTAEPDGSKARFGVNSSRHPEAERFHFYEMPHDQALQFAEDTFKYDYFNWLMGYEIKDQSIANKVCDIAYNCGLETGIKIAQRAVNACHDMGIVVDGKFGNLTLAALNACEPTQLLGELREQQKGYYLGLAAANPAKFKAVLNGWLARAAS